MSKVVNIHKKRGVRPYFDIYIGRRTSRPTEFKQDSKWANRFYERLDLYEKYIREVLWDDLDELEGKILGCWCKPGPCHGDILIKLIKEKKINGGRLIF